ncbi:MAG: SRPBCC family protein [Betaproteobacteria bacterium]|nr:SRPBCC family protein [Betaproteobacteria bacterium]MBI2227247.1 SRPBCC family protein [Betaproteobacteria bacterium]MBI3053286.1 SRPBCC family protein [Betaproteobacteria bacterium]
MTPLSEQFTIPGPPAEIWPLLRDPALVASCIPGAALTTEQPGGVYQGTVTVKFGPTVAVFRGEATLTYDDAARRCTIEGRGVDQRGASRLLVSSVVTASGTDTTLVTMDGGFNVAGPLEMFAQAGGVHVARALMGEFATNIARIVEERRAPAAGAAASPSPLETPPSARSLGAGALLWKAFLEWLKQFFFKREKRGDS